MSIFENTKHPRAGKITLATVIGVAVTLTTTFFAYFEVGLPWAAADNVNTSVTVLNTPPQWTRNAHETTASATNTPTNAGVTIYWQANANDTGSDPWYLLICKTSGAPTPNTSAAPTCPGGAANQWAVSTTTFTNSQTASAATTTTDNFPFDQESNDWYAWVCDGNITGPACVSTYTNSDATDSNYPDSNSPFVVNHTPYFFSVSNDGPAWPGQDVTWSTAATDTDVLRTGGDTIKLLVCRTAALSNGNCTGGAWASSTLTHFNPSTTTPIVIPTQDKLYNAFVYVVDQSNLGARAGTTSIQGFNSSFTVGNATPTVSASSIVVGSTSLITLNNPHATSMPYYVKFTVTDANSCQNSSSGNEISSATTSIYRSGIGQGGCQTAGQYDTNNCYTSLQSTDPAAAFTCTQDAATCSGSSDTTADWTCTFRFWYNADPTDAGSFYAAENWLASVQVLDDNYATSSITEASTPNELVQFLAYDVATTSIAYGGLQPGASSTFTQTTDLKAWGNVGLDQNLYGDTMCTNWSVADSCDAGGIDPTSEIPVNNQWMATTSASWGGVGIHPLAGSTTPYQLHINVLKTVATNTVQTKDTYWAIGIPGAITTSGSYSGQNTLIAVTASSSVWY